jgi:hypothetical protein
MPLDGSLSEHWRRVQGELFPWLEEHVGPLGPRHRLLVTALELARIESFLPALGHWLGRPPACRAALARAFLAKAVLDLPMTVMLRERLLVDKTLRRLCGWERASQVPSEATFSRAFAGFAASCLPERAHAALVEARLGGCLIGHVSRDGTAIPARERPPLAAAPKQPEKRRGRGRPRKGEIVEKPVRRLATQPGMSLEAMLADLPRACSIGNRKNAKGYKEFWRGYRLHIDVADGDIPVSCLLTGAHVHDSQAAIPLAVMTARRVTNLYDLMDSAYDVREIHDHSRRGPHAACCVGWATASAMSRSSTRSPAARRPKTPGPTRKKPVSRSPGSPPKPGGWRSEPPASASTAGSRISSAATMSASAVRPRPCAT